MIWCHMSISFVFNVIIITSFLFKIKQEEVVTKVKQVVNDLAVSFPRLLMLSDWEVLSLNSHHGNPALVLPAIRRMFPAVCSINTIEIQKTPSNESSVEESGPLREEGYQIVSVEGCYSELLTFCVPLPIGQRKACEWLSGFEKAIRYSLSCHLTGCLENLPQRIIGNVALEEEGTFSCIPVYPVSIVHCTDECVYMCIILVKI